MSDVVVRAPEQSDKAFLREMLETAALPTYPELRTLGRLSLRDRLDEIFNYHYAQELKRIWIAQAQGGERLGAIWLQPSIHPVTELPDYLVLNLSVVEAARGRGVAKRLMTHARDWCRDQGVRRLRLFVGVENEGAYELYRKLGFEEQTREMLWRF